jgi:hypothetical protein
MFGTDVCRVACRTSVATVCPKLPDVVVTLASIPENSFVCVQALEMEFGSLRDELSRKIYSIEAAG